MRNALLPLFVLAACSSSKGGDGESHDHGAHGGEDQSLRSIMKGLDRNLKAIRAASAEQDWARVEREARAIAEHPHVSAAELERIKSTLGSDMPAFVAIDRKVHEGALRLSDAAGKGDATVVQNELRAMASGCEQCHFAFRKRLAPPGAR